MPGLIAVAPLLQRLISTTRGAIQMLRDMDKAIVDTAARLEHCRALIRESDRLLESLRALQSPSADVAEIDEQ